MAEPFFRLGEIVLPPLIAANGTRMVFQGLENIPKRGGALIALNHTSYLDWLPASYAAYKRHRRLKFMIKAEMQDVPGSETGKASVVTSPSSRGGSSQ